ncbi:shikimate kinase [Thermodesulfobacteriota bacterium]
MQENRSNIVLIGMPGSGKSTAGVILAKMMSKDFIDTDVLIQVSQGRSLQDIVDVDGHMALREIEEKELLVLNCKNHIIATGGSAVYSEKAMIHLKSDGVLVFLDVNLHNLLSRVYDFATRGLAKPSEQSFAELFEERIELYRQFADITVKGSGFTQEEVCAEIIRTLSSDQDQRTT